MPVPNTFGTATSAIPLSQLDANFATPITIGNTAVQLGNTVTTLNNMTLANVTISSGTITITNVSVTTANVSGTANVSTLVVVGNATVGGNTTITGNITAANANVTSNLVLSGGTANGVAFLNGSKVLTTGSALVFDGTNFATTGSVSAGGVVIATGALGGHGASRVVMDYSTGTSRIWGYGVNAGTIGEVAIQLRSSDGSLGATAATFSSTGLAITGLTDISAATSGQIKFPATQNASSNANTLDDYEEGTWTPSFTLGTGSATVNNASGTYVKIGKQVTVTISLSFTTATAATIDTITGFTFPSETANQFAVGALRENSNTGFMWQLKIGSNASTAVIRKYDNTQVLTAGDNFVGTLTYFTT